MESIPSALESYGPQVRRVPQGWTGDEWVSGGTSLRAAWAPASAKVRRIKGVHCSSLLLETA